jgi:hypothetical protein
MTDSALIITHGDVDGMVCAAQLIRRERGDCEVVFSNADRIARKLEAVPGSQEMPRRRCLAGFMSPTSPPMAKRRGSWRNLRAPAHKSTGLTTIPGQMDLSRRCNQSAQSWFTTMP